MLWFAGSQGLCLGFWTTDGIVLAFSSCGEESQRLVTAETPPKESRAGFEANVKPSARDDNTAPCHPPAIPPHSPPHVFSEGFIIVSARVIALWTTFPACSEVGPPRKASCDGLAWATATARGSGRAGAGAGVPHLWYFGISLGAAFGLLMRQAPSAAC